MRADDPNLPLLIGVAEALGDLCDGLVFVGGCAAGLLATDEAASGVRPTQDVDAIVEAATLTDFHAVEALLPQRGFVRDADSPVICRWRHRASGAAFDLMPTEPAVLGFANRWYPEAAATAIRVALTERVHIRLISAPCFVATKLEAFATRGNQDLYSHDLEDTLMVADGRPSLPDELRLAAKDLRQAVAGQLAALLQRNDFGNVLPGLIGDPRRVGIVHERLRSMAA